MKQFHQIPEGYSLNVEHVGVPIPADPSYRNFALEDYQARYSAVEEAERITAQAAAEAEANAQQHEPAETLYEYTFVAFTNTLERMAQKSPIQTEYGGLFSVFEAVNTDFPTVQVGFNWFSEPIKSPTGDNSSFLGSIFLSDTTEHGTDVIAYNFTQTAAGPAINRTVAFYDTPHSAEALAAESARGFAGGILQNDLPGMTNSELSAVINFANTEPPVANPDMQAGAYRNSYAVSDFGEIGAGVASAASEAGADAGGDATL